MQLTGLTRHIFVAVPSHDVDFHHIYVVVWFVFCGVHVLLILVEIVTQQRYSFLFVRIHISDRSQLNRTHALDTISIKIP